MNATALNLSIWQPRVLGILRIVAGLLFLSHGLVKVFGFPVGAQPGQQILLSLMGVGGLIELLCGLLIVVGIFTRPAAFIASGETAFAYWMFHAPKSFFPVINQGDAAILFCFVFLYLSVAGPGDFALARRPKPEA